jgi:hypothetical protein
MSLKFNTLYDYENINNNDNISNNNNDTKIENIPIEEGKNNDLTKNFIKLALNNKFNKNEEQKLKLNPSNFSINNQNLYTMFKLEYTLIEDFLIRTKLNFTRNIFNNEIKSIINPLLPLDDGELSSLLGINLNELSSIRFKWNNNSKTNEDIICSTYLYHILNKHTKITKLDSECQTVNKSGISDEFNFQSQNLENIFKKIEDKYEKKIKEKNDFFALEKKFEKYKEELDSRYEIDLKNEIERFKLVELSKMRIEENKKYSMRIDKLREEYQEEYNKKYEEMKKLKKELKEREINLRKEFEERSIKLKKDYEEKEKNLEEKKLFWEKKYKNEKNEASIQINKFNEELDDLKKSFYKSEKEKQLNNIKNNNQELNPLINNEINNLREQIDEIKNNLIRKNNFIKDEDKKNIKPSKKSVINSLENFAKNNNNVNATRSSNNSQSGSGIYNSNSYSNNNPRKQYKKDRLKVLEKLEEEENQLNNKLREFTKIIHSDVPIFTKDRFESNDIMKISKYKTNDNEILNINNEYSPNTYKIKKDVNLNENNIEKNIEKNDNNNIEININKIDDNQKDNNTQKNIIINKEENNNNKNEFNIGGFNIGGYNINNINNENNKYNYPIKGESESIIEENLEGGENMNSMHQKKENNNISKKNAFINQNKYQDRTNPIKEEFEGESGGSNNNSKENIYNNKNNINVSKSNNKFNNYDLGEFEVKNDSKNDEIKNEGEIEEEIINYGNSGVVDDRKDKDKIISGSISGIAKKQYEISESAGFKGLLQMQSHVNFKDEKDEFEFSKGKNNNMNNQKTESGKISEEIESDGPF